MNDLVLAFSFFNRLALSADSGRGEVPRKGAVGVALKVAGADG